MSGYSCTSWCRAGLRNVLRPVNKRGLLYHQSIAFEQPPASTRFERCWKIHSGRMDRASSSSAGLRTRSARGWSFWSTSKASAWRRFPVISEPLARWSGGLRGWGFDSGDQFAGGEGEWWTGGADVCFAGKKVKGDTPCVEKFRSDPCHSI